MDTGKKERKRMSPKAKKIINIIITSLQVAVVVATVAISIFVWTTTGRGEPAAKSIQMLAIRSNSMKGDAPDSFNAGDLVIVKAPKDASALEIGTVVAYKHTVSGGATTIITHRIVEIIPPNEEGGNIRYRTQGDNAEDPDSYAVQAGDVVGIYSSKLKGVGTALLWLQGFKKVELDGGDYGWDYVGNSNNFLYVIIIPLIALLLWNGYAMIRVIMEGKIKKARDEAAAAAVAASASGNAAALDAEEIKRRAIEEYLASLSANSPLAKPPQNQEISGNLDGGSIASTEAEPEKNPPLEKGGSILSEETGSPQNTSFVGKGETEQSGASDAQAAASGERQSRRNGGFDNSVAQTAIQPEAPAPQEPVAVEAEPEQNSPLEKGGSILSEENAQNGGFDKQPAKPAPKAASKTPAKAPAKTAAKAPAKKPKSE